MTEAYSIRFRRLALDTARDLSISLHEGVYAGLSGPSYETPAEIRFLKTIGADLVGMSTVPETIAANHLGMEVLGLACVTNLAAGLSAHKLVHDEVLDTTRRVSGTFLKLLNALIPRMAAL
jgi:purine-nucleoside phosphorylase